MAERINKWLKDELRKYEEKADLIRTFVVGEVEGGATFM